MPKFTVRQDGSIEADTPEAAVALARLAAASTPATARRGPGDPWSALMGHLGEKQRATLRAIKERDSITLTELVGVLSVTRKHSVAAYLTHVIRNAGNVGIGVADVFRRSEQGYGAKREIWYRPGPLLREREVPAEAA